MGMVAHTCNPGTRRLREKGGGQRAAEGRGSEDHKSESSLVHTVSVNPVRPYLNKQTSKLEVEAIRLLALREDA